MRHLRVNPLGKKICQDHRPRTGIAFPDERVGLTHHFSIAGHEGYPNGQPGEIFIRMAKED